MLAQTWEIEPAVAIQEIFTDNVDLDAERKVSDFVTTVIGSIDIIGRSRRITANVGAGVSYDKYIERDEFDGFRPSLLGVAQFEAIDDTLFFDARAAINDRNFNRATPSPGFNRSFDAERARVYTYNFGSRFNQDLAEWISFFAQAQFAGALFGDPDVGDATKAPRDRQTATVLAGFSSGRTNDRVHWSIFAQNSQDLGSVSDFKARSVQGRVDYNLTRKSSIYLVGGYDDYQDPTLDENKRSGAFALVGVQLKPGSRLVFDGAIGHRWGDISGRASLSYEFSRFLDLNISYEELVQTQQQALAGELTGLSFDANIDLVNPVGVAADFTPDNLDLVDSAFKENRLNAAIIGRTDRSDFILSLFQYTRVFDFDNTDETVAGGRLSFSRELTRYLSAGIDFDYEKTLDARLMSTDRVQQFGARAGIVYRFSPTFDLRADYSFRRHDLRVDFVTENSVSLFLRKTF